MQEECYFRIKVFKKFLAVEMKIFCGRKRDTSESHASHFFLQNAEFYYLKKWGVPVYNEASCSFMLKMVLTLLLTVVNDMSVFSRRNK